MKTCSCCKQAKTLNKFRFIRKNKDGSDLYRAKCYDCYNKIYNERYQSKSEEERRQIYLERKNKYTFEERKQDRLKRRFGLTIDEFDKMLTEQSGKCYLCFTEILGKEVKVDHSHKTGKVRKLLCHNCNTALGHLRDDVDLFKRCIDYLEYHDNIQENKMAESA